MTILAVIKVTKEFSLKQQSKKIRTMEKYLLFMFAAMLTVSLSVSAQNRQGKQGNLNNNQVRQSMQMTAKERVEWMAKTVELTDAQKAELEVLLKKQEEQRTADMAKMKELRNQTTANRDEMRAKREEVMKQNQAEIEKIIGKEKAEKLNELRKSRMDSNRQGRRN